MSNTKSRSSIDDRIALIPDDIRQFIEQAAGYSGARARGDQKPIT